MCYVVYCVCVCVVSCDGIDRHGIVWPLLLLLRVEAVLSLDSLAVVVEG